MNKFFSNKIVKAFAFLFSGQILGQLISLVGAFYIPKLLGAEQYGNYQVIINYVLLYRLSTFTGISKYNIRELSVNKHNTSSIISSTILIRLATSFLGVVLGLVVLSFISYNSIVNKGIILFFLYLFLFSISDSLCSILVSKIEFKKLSLFNVLKSLTQVLLSILFLNFGYSEYALVIIYLFVEFFFLSLVYNEVCRNHNFSFSIVKFSWRELFNKGYKFSFIEFLNLLSSRIDIFMLSILVEPALVGVYAFANTIARKGLIVRRALQQPLYPHYANISINERSFKMLNRHFIMIAGISSLIVLVIFISSGYVIPLIAGIEFEQSVEIIKVLVFYLFFHYAVLPFNSFIEAQKFENLSLKIGVFRATTNVITNIVFFNFFGVIGIAYSTVLVWVLNFLVFYFLSFSTIKNALK